MIYDDLLLVFGHAIFIFVIILQAKSSSFATYDENGQFFKEDISFCDESEQRHEQIVTNDHFSSSGRGRAEPSPATPAPRHTTHPRRAAPSAGLTPPFARR
jgi:hypothetical protein